MSKVQAPSNAVDDPTDDAFLVEGLSLTIERKTILRDVTLAFPKGEFVALVGHNGSGKSTLLRIMARQQRATSGSVRYRGESVFDFEERNFARKVAYLPQDVATGTELSVRELVACGRYPWHGPLGRFSGIDRQKVEDALVSTHVEGFADRLVGTLSGGERQRAWIAMLIAQDSECLLLDEPTAALDIAHQIEVLSLVRKLSHEKGASVVIVLHDINLAARFCDRIHALKDGRVEASGAPADIVAPKALKDIYGIDMGVLPHPGLSIPLAYVS